MAALVAVPTMAQKKKKYLYETSRHLDTTGYYYYEAKRNAENKLSDMIEVLITNTKGEPLSTNFWMIMCDGDTVKLTTNADGTTEVAYSLFRKMNAFCSPAHHNYKTLYGVPLRYLEFKKANTPVPMQTLSLRLVLYTHDEQIETGRPFDLDFSEKCYLHSNHRIAPSEALELIKEVIIGTHESPLWKEVDAEHVIEI